jgi:hypothetical protein
MRKASEGFRVLQFVTVFDAPTWSAACTAVEQWPVERSMSQGRTTMKMRAFACALVMATTTLRAGSAEKLTLRVTPAVAFAPANLIVRTMILADPDNRAVEVIAESPEYYRSSEIQLNGEQAPRTTTFEFRSLPPGTYQVKALLLNSTGRERAAAVQQVNVIASGGAR